MEIRKITNPGTTATEVKFDVCHSEYLIKNMTPVSIYVSVGAYVSDALSIIIPSNTAQLVKEQCSNAVFNVKAAESTTGIVEFDGE